MGGGITYNDLSLSKDGSDLVLNAGATDQLRFKDWYGGKDNVVNLQVNTDATAAFDATSSDPLFNKKVQTFDFRGLVSAFDEALAQSPGLSSWAVTNALLQFHLERGRRSPRRRSCILVWQERELKWHQPAGSAADAR